MDRAKNNPQRGEIWLVQFDPTIGSEMQKTRPSVVVNENEIGRIGLRIVVPITGWQDRFAFWPWMINLPPHRDNGLDKSSGADTSQVKSISLQRFQTKLGFVQTSEIREIVAGIALCIGYESFN